MLHVLPLLCLYLTFFLYFFVCVFATICCKKFQTKMQTVKEYQHLECLGLANHVWQKDVTQLFQGEMGIKLIPTVLHNMYHHYVRKDFENVLNILWNSNAFHLSMQVMPYIPYYLPPYLIMTCIGFFVNGQHLFYTFLGASSSLLTIVASHKTWCILPYMAGCSQCQGCNY